MDMWGRGIFVCFPAGHGLCHNAYTMSLELVTPTPTPHKLVLLSLASLALICLFLKFIELLCRCCLATFILFSEISRFLPGFE